MWKKILLGLVIAAGVITIVIYTTLQSQRWRCEVCITYKGRTNCGAARAETRDGAKSTAANTACAFIASGMTERIACPNTPPTREQCQER